MPDSVFPTDRGVRENCIATARASRGGSIKYVQVVFRSFFRIGSSRSVVRGPYKYRLGVRASARPETSRRFRPNTDIGPCSATDSDRFATYYVELLGVCMCMNDVTFTYLRSSTYFRKKLEKIQSTLNWFLSKLDFELFLHSNCLFAVLIDVSKWLKVYFINYKL